MAFFAGGHDGLKSSAVRWLIVFFLGVIAACLLLQTQAVSQPAQAQSVTAGKGSSLFALGGQITKDTYGLYIVDPENGTITVYQWSPGERKLELLASRNINYDRLLDEYNTKPSPREIKDLVEMHRRIDSKKLNDLNTTPPPGEAKDRPGSREAASEPSSR